MRKITFAAAILTLLAGCASDGSFMGIGGRSTAGDGGNVGTRDTRAPRYTDRAYPEDRANPYARGMQQYDDKFWPPVVQGQAFPPQHMWAD